MSLGGMSSTVSTGGGPASIAARCDARSASAITLLLWLAAAMSASRRGIMSASRSDGDDASLYIFITASTHATEPARGSTSPDDAAGGAEAAAGGGATGWTTGAAAAGVSSGTTAASEMPSSFLSMPFTSSSVLSSLLASGSRSLPDPKPGPPRCFRSRPWRVRTLRRTSSFSSVVGRAAAGEAGLGTASAATTGAGGSGFFASCTFPLCSARSDGGTTTDSPNPVPDMPLSCVTTGLEGAGGSAAGAGGCSIAFGCSVALGCSVAFGSGGARAAASGGSFVETLGISAAGPPLLLAFICSSFSL
mmetsp:Transcript_27209/g.61059  ORF Transcript_27209/g.61059 Transcript_27209/m.61059 type:complete len:305 (-) Transcript_27209:1107-2021(-)